jgi:uncharacterized protein YdcH (DUF465 family)
MTHTPHELADLFPDDAEMIHDLKARHTHFARLADEHHAVNREIHRIEAQIETASDAHTEGLKKRRLALQDEIAAMLAAAKGAT